MKLGLGLGISRYTQTGLRFLFANGEAGAWYDPSDLTTLYQDAAGTTPVATDADVVGLAVDTSEGGLNSLGPESVTNGGFDADLTGWTFGTAGGGSGSQSWEAGKLRLTNSTTTGYVRTSQTITGLTVGTTYEISGEPTAISGTPSEFRATIAGVADIDHPTKFSGVFVANSTSHLLLPSAIQTGSATPVVLDIDNISVREVPGNHASQSTTSYKPKWYSPNILRFDGVDDRLVTTLKPTTTGSIAMRFKGSTASRVAFGAQPASNGKCYLGLASDGSIAGGIGTQATSTIKGSTDKRGAWVTAILTWDGSTVTLYEDGVSVYSAAQSGAVDTANSFNFGSLNNAGSSAAHFDGDVSNLIVTDDVITASEALKIHNKWSA